MTTTPHRPTRLLWACAIAAAALLPGCFTGEAVDRALLSSALMRFDDRDPDRDLAVGGCAFGDLSGGSYGGCPT